MPGLDDTFQDTWGDKLMKGEVTLPWMEENDANGRFDGLFQDISNDKSFNVHDFKTRENLGGFEPHMVQKGDTVWDLSQKHGVSVDEIVQNNEFLKERRFKDSQDRDMISIRQGDTINIPSSNTKIDSGIKIPRINDLGGINNVDQRFDVGGHHFGGGNNFGAGGFDFGRDFDIGGNHDNHHDFIRDLDIGGHNGNHHDFARDLNIGGHHFGGGNNFGAGGFDFGFHF